MKTLTDRINDAIGRDNAAQTKLPVDRAPVISPARTYLSPTDSYDNDIGFDNPYHGHAPGRLRGMWSVAEQQQASVPVTNLTSSGNSQSNFKSAIQGGIPQNPRAPATTWAAVPQMILNLTAQGPIMLHASCSVRSSIANDTAGFAIYRDGRLIGNHLTHTTAATASGSSLVHLSAIDNPTPGNHVYAMYWSPGTGTLVAVSNYRNLYAINLAPQ